MIINLTGQAGAGKTSIAAELCSLIPMSINIDGDELRHILNNADYSETGRRNNITTAYNIARFLEHKDYIPIISLISPFRDLREDLKKTNMVVEFYIFTTEKRGREKYFAPNYQPPQDGFFAIDTTDCSASDKAREIALILSSKYHVLTRPIYVGENN